MGNKHPCALEPGDVLPGEPRVIAETTRSTSSVTARFVDGSSQTWDLAGDPSVTVVDPAPVDAAEVTPDG